MGRLAPRYALTAAMLLSLGLLADAAPPVAKVYLDGKVASSDVRTVNGRAYVSLHDLAKALGLVVVRRGDGYALQKPGGANQVGDLSGKVGDVLFDGKWRFQVVSVQAVDSYAVKTSSEPTTRLSDTAMWNPTDRTLRAKPGHKLIVVQVRVSNGQKTTQTLWTSPSDNTMRTALTDADGSSHPPMAYDYPGGPNVTKPLLPGASVTFPVLFGIPPNTRLKDLVFTLKNNDYSAKGSDARVSLNTGNNAP